MADLLLELRSEEIPARMQAAGAQALQDRVLRLLEGAGLPWDESKVRTYATPRRIAVLIPGVPEGQEDRVVERRGPKVDAPPPAVDGFRRSLEGTTHTIETRQEKKGAVFVARIEEPGRGTGEILAAAIPGLLEQFPWPKSMRWGEGTVRWVRPLHSIVCLLDEDIVPFRFGQVNSGRTTVGHRFLAPDPIEIGHPGEYADRLRSVFVLADPEERRTTIAEAASALAATEGLRVIPDPGLLQEVTGLVEWPVPLIGSIDEQFMSLPPEVLATTMRQHQKYLGLRSGSGDLAPRFIVVANLTTGDDGAAIREGNERVLRARLWDAHYFWTSDRAVRLEERLPALDRMVFHAELGSIGQRVLRLEALAGEMTQWIPGAEREHCRRAGRLAKADLVAGMVGEFPELQGVMGSYYAGAQGEPEAVARAIAEHYSPKGPDDRIPTAPESVALALAERVDLLVGFFARGIKPTGSKDPFALRRAALGVIRLITENDLRVPLRTLVLLAHDQYGSLLAGSVASEVADDLLAFVADRLKGHLRSTGARHELIAAVFGAVADDDLVRLLRRVEALESFMAGSDGPDLVAGVKRAANIVGIESQRDGVGYDQPVEVDRLIEPAERALYDALSGVDLQLAGALEHEDYEGAMTVLASLRQPVDAFFDSVLVNDPEPSLRVNRLRLLSRISGAFREIADIGSLGEQK